MVEIFIYRNNKERKKITALTYPGWIGEENSSNHVHEVVGDGDLNVVLNDPRIMTVDSLIITMLLSRTEIKHGTSICPYLFNSSKKKKKKLLATICRRRLHETWSFEMSDTQAVLPHTLDYPNS